MHRVIENYPKPQSNVTGNTPLGGLHIILNNNNNNTYIRPFRDEILTASFIFSTWLYNYQFFQGRVPQKAKMPALMLSHKMDFNCCANIGTVFANPVTFVLLQFRYILNYVYDVTVTLLLYS